MCDVIDLPGAAPEPVKNRRVRGLLPGAVPFLPGVRRQQEIERKAREPAPPAPPKEAQPAAPIDVAYKEFSHLQFELAVIVNVLQGTLQRVEEQVALLGTKRSG